MKQHRLSFNYHHIFSVLGIIQSKDDMGIVPHLAYLLARGLTEDQNVLPIPEKEHLDKMWATIWPHGAEPENAILAQALVNRCMLWIGKSKHSKTLYVDRLYCVL